MHQKYPMFELGNNDASVLHLGKLRKFLNETYRSLFYSISITINSVVGYNTIVPCIQVLADKESI